MNGLDAAKLGQVSAQINQALRTVPQEKLQQLLTLAKNNPNGFTTAGVTTPDSNESVHMVTIGDGRDVLELSGYGTAYNDSSSRALKGEPDRKSVLIDPATASPILPEGENTLSAATLANTLTDEVLAGAEQNIPPTVIPLPEGPKPGIMFEIKF